MIRIPARSALKTITPKKDIAKSVISLSPNASIATRRKNAEHARQVSTSMTTIDAALAQSFYTV
jgi:hypothetical protein